MIVRVSSVVSDRGYQFGNNGQSESVSRGDRRNGGRRNVELNVRIRDFEKPWNFHLLADLEYPCILEVDFIGGSKITLDFERKSLAIADSKIDKVVKPIEEGNVEIDLSKTGENVERGKFNSDSIHVRVISYVIDKNDELPPDNPEAYRFDVDYRKLNSITKYPRYPLPFIDDLIMNIPHTTVMSSNSGYFQLAVNPSYIVKTAFVTKNDTYAFRRMPFGLSGVAPNFQKAIDIILKRDREVCIWHVKTVEYRTGANRTKRVINDLVQMIANYVNDQHDTLDYSPYVSSLMSFVRQ
ncbi:uncharacterized protein TNCV_1292301 [Trichonephila clavipes]|nr:uncharacterized protein TNCV_1292301 [Trichonephila clavipes]